MTPIIDIDSRVTLKFNAIIRDKSMDKKDVIMKLKTIIRDKSTDVRYATLKT